MDYTKFKIIRPNHQEHQFISHSQFIAHNHPKVNENTRNFQRQYFIAAVFCEAANKISPLIFSSILIDFRVIVSNKLQVSNKLIFYVGIMGYSLYLCAIDTTVTGRGPTHKIITSVTYILNHLWLQLLILVSGRYSSFSSKFHGICVTSYSSYISLTVCSSVVNWFKYLIYLNFSQYLLQYPLCLVTVILYGWIHGNLFSHITLLYARNDILVGSIPEWFQPQMRKIT